MKKSAFLTLLAGAVGGLLFALGMCMCLLPQWDALSQGKIVSAAGLIILTVLGAAAIIKYAKHKKPTNWKIIGKILYGAVSALVMGVGMCMVMVWQMTLPGIAVGILGIIMLLCLIPMCMGLKS